MPPDAQKWLDFAREDLQMAKLAMRDALFNQVCFHAQQAAEKTLKYLLVNAGILPPKTHKLGDLLGLSPVAVPDDLYRKLLLLDRFYIPTRYPDAVPGSLVSGMPDQADAEEALSSSMDLDVWALKL
jgi:HEPN domain-containing protein